MGGAVAPLQKKKLPVATALWRDVNNCCSGTTGTTRSWSRLETKCERREKQIDRRTDPLISKSIGDCPPPGHDDSG